MDHHLYSNIYLIFLQMPSPIRLFSIKKVCVTPKNIRFWLTYFHGMRDEGRAVIFISIFTRFSENRHPTDRQV